MGWWPFNRKSTPRLKANEPLMKDARMWISELRDICERHYQFPEEARRQIRQMQVEWNDALQAGFMNQPTREGLQSRAFHLLTCEDEVWMSWLDNLDFWKPGWKPIDENQNEP